MSKNGADDALPNISRQHLEIPAYGKLAVDAPAAHRPRILLLYGSLRARSYSRFLTFEAARLLETFGAETRIFDPRGLPLPDGAPESHHKVRELLDLAVWSEGQVWCSPERHGAMSGVMKSMIDWIPLSVGRVRQCR
jgi:arsenic resistance protein ArsH